MRFHVITSKPETTKSDCLIVGVSGKNNLSPAAKRLNKASKGKIQELLDHGDFTGKTGEMRYIYDLKDVVSKRVLLVGCGEDESRDTETWKKITNNLFTVLKKGDSKDAASFLDEIPVKEREQQWKLSSTAQIISNMQYKRGELKSDRKKKKDRLQALKFSVAKKQVKSARLALAQGQAIGRGMLLARRLGDLPANVCTPSYMAQQSRKLAEQHENIAVKVLSETQMKKQGMGALLSVTAGTNEPAKLIIMEYQGAEKDKKPVALVGKGVTFDSGGISLKPGAAMDEMKYDMCGAASVLGTFSAIAELKLPINVIGVIPATENMPSGHATKPGDIVKSMSGKTIEILNTDAEGRLILCDALTYVQKYKPEAVIDIATLTGAVIIALGNHNSGLLGNDEELVQAVLSAGKAIDDKAWQLPLGEKYQHQLDSNFADMANIGGREAGTITAACFLSRFTEDVPWAHLDIAGTAWNSGKLKGATGRPVPLLTQFLINRSL
ncbi:MAG: leucyl aminopeptidase [Gammaproteobacteria bacterium]|nr:MAG: leucyl aminopeptidase [Gammaproteobacteria bacterium]